MNYSVALMVSFYKRKNIFDEEDFSLVLEGITMHDVEAFIPRMLTRFFTDSLMYGNLTEDVRNIDLFFIKI